MGIKSFDAIVFVVRGWRKLAVLHTHALFKLSCKATCASPQRQSVLVKAAPGPIATMMMDMPDEPCHLNERTAVSAFWWRR